jgi:hypothetical protein
MLRSRASPLSPGEDPEIPLVKILHHPPPQTENHYHTFFASSLEAKIPQSAYDELEKVWVEAN